MYENHLMQRDPLIELQSRAARTDARLDALSKDVENIALSVQGLADIMRDGSKTPWNNIIAAVGVAFAILSAVFTIVVTNQNSITSRLEQGLQEMARRHVAHITMPAHPVMMQRADDIDRRLQVVEAWQRNNNVKNTAEISAIRERLKVLEKYDSESKRLRSQ